MAGTGLHPVLAINALAAYTGEPPFNDPMIPRILRYACRCTYIIFMRKPFEAKFMHMHETADDAREAIRRVGSAAESQARLNIALTGVCVAALLVAVLVVRSQRTDGAL